MVSEERLALGPADRLLAGYMIFLTLVIVARGDTLAAHNVGMLIMHALYGVLLFLFTRLRSRDTVGRFVHDLHPLLFLIPLYAQFSLIHLPSTTDTILRHDAIVQRWEEWVFGGQISYMWIRQAPSVFWSGVFHMAYFMYYPIVSTPLFMWVLGRRENVGRIIFPMMVAFVLCYLVFVLWPVAGPYYAFERPTGPVRDVWSARVVYLVLVENSSFGTAFPSSHVAATLVATLSQLRYERNIGLSFVVPCLLLIVGTVYTQMHYGIDAAAGMVIGLVAFWIGGKVQPWRSRSS